MPFYVYRCENNEYTQASPATLAGYGPFYEAAMARSPEWELREQDLLSWHKVDPQGHAIVIDLKPAMHTVNLYRLKYVWGYTSDNWTPMAWELEKLYNDHVPASGVSVQEFKRNFAGPSTGDLVYEFLYLKGDWNFGRVGSVNAALLWDSPTVRTFDSLMKRINRKRRDVDGLPQVGCLD